MSMGAGIAARVAMSFGAPVERTMCRRCQQSIFRLVDDGRTWAAKGYLATSSWYHEGGERGCRAASFEPDIGWDDSLNRRWVATP